MLKRIKNKIKNFYQFHKNYFKWLFKKDEIDFDKNFTAEEATNAIKNGDIYALRKIMPKFKIGKQHLTRKQSFLFLTGSFTLCLVISVFCDNFLPMLFFVGSIAHGSEYDFNPATTYDISTALIDSTHFVVAYRDAGHSHYGTAIIGTISGSTISYGSEYVFNSNGSYDISISMLDSTHFVVVYCNGSPGYGKAIIGTISGSTISYGSEYTFNSGDTRYTVVSMLDNTHFVVVYQEVGSSYGRAIIGAVSGSTISYGSVYTFNSALTRYISITLIDSTHFVVAYQDVGNSSRGTAIIGTISGSAISYGSEYVFNSDSTYYISVALLNSTHFVVAYRDAGHSHYGTAIIGTISGSTISYGSEYVFNSGTTNYISVSVLDSTHFVVTYQDAYNSDYGTAVVGIVSGSTIAHGDEYIFNLGDTEYIFVTTIDSTHFVVAYQDISHSYYGTAVIGTYTAPVIPTVTTQNCTNIDQNIATGNGNITNTGGNNCSDRGFCYVEGTSGDPTINSDVLLDSYNENNSNGVIDIYNGYVTRIGQSFIGNGCKISSCKFYLRKSGSPTGNATATIYAHTGTYGVDGTPTGSVLATSDVIDVSTLSTSSALVTFNFTTTIRPTNGTYYFIIFEYTGGDSSNKVYFGLDTSPTHNGNLSLYLSSWGDYDYAACFYLYTKGESYDSGSFSTGIYTKDLYRLLPGTDYRVRAYATNIAGTGYGSTVQLTTIDGFTNPLNAFVENGVFTTTSAPNGNLYVSLSKNGGTSYTSELLKTFTGTNAYLTYGNGETELWGTSFSGGSISDINFRLKMRCESPATAYQVYKNFNFSIPAGRNLIGIEVKIKAKWVTDTMFIDNVIIKIYYGNSVLPIQAGSQVFASDGRKNGEGAGNGSGVLVFYDGNDWIASDSGAIVAA